MSSLNLGTGVVSPSSGAYVWPAPDLIKIRWFAAASSSSTMPSGAGASSPRA